MNSVQMIKITTLETFRKHFATLQVLHYEHNVLAFLS